LGPEDKLLEPPAEYVIPADVVGRRPAGEKPVGAGALVMQAAISLYYHFAEILKVSLLGALIAIVALIAILGPVAALLKGHPAWLVYANAIVLLPILGPAYAGYQWALLLAVQRLFPKAREVLRPFRDRTCYANVFLAAAPAYLGGVGLLALRQLSVSLADGHIAPVSPEFRQLLDEWLGPLITALVLTPLQFAPLHALAAGANYRQAVVRSVRFAYCQSHLFGGYALVVVGLRLLQNVLEYTLPRAEHGARVLDPTSTPGLVALAVVGMLIPLETVVGALFYREFVWREREAGAQAARSA
jgi:hypothetical protein